MPFQRRVVPVEVLERGAAGGVHAAAQVDEPARPVDEGGEEVRGEDVDGEDAWMAVDAPVRLGVGVDAGVVDDGVERSERVHVGGEASGLVEVGEVTDHQAAGVAERPEVVSALTVAGVEDDVVAVRRGGWWRRRGRGRWWIR